jgi:hypothetical protein
MPNEVKQKLEAVRTVIDDVRKISNDIVGQANNALNLIAQQETGAINIDATQKENFLTCYKDCKKKLLAKVKELP